MTNINGDDQYTIDVNQLMLLSGCIGFFTKNIVGVYLNCNGMFAEKLCLQSPRDIIGITDFQLPIYHEEAEILKSNDRDVLLHQRARQFHNTITIHSNKFDILSTKIPLLGSNNMIMGIFGFSIYLNDRPSNDQVSEKALTRILNKTTLLDKAIKKYSLSNREVDCLHHLVRGKTCREISEALKLSIRTVESYVVHIKVKLNCKTKSMMIDKAIQLGFLKS